MPVNSVMLIAHDLGPAILQCKKHTQEYYEDKNNGGANHVCYLEPLEEVDSKYKNYVEPGLDQ